MTKKQLREIREKYPREMELVLSDMYDWEMSYMVYELLRWMPASELMKLVHQMEDQDGTE